MNYNLPLRRMIFCARRLSLWMKYIATNFGFTEGCRAWDFAIRPIMLQSVSVRPAG